MLKESKLPPLEVTGRIIGGLYPELQPYVAVRKCHWYRVYGLRASAIDEAIERGDIPKPIAFGKRAVGWTGVQINEHHRKKVAEAASKPKEAV
jgi:predicted DNA-binding transcriptional regulator AlpA